MFTLIAAFGATLGAMALLLTVTGRLSAETMAVALLVLVLAFIAVLFSTDSLHKRPVGDSSGFQLFTRRHARRWPMPLALLSALAVVAYLAFRPEPTATVEATATTGITREAVTVPTVVLADAGNGSAHPAPGAASATPPTSEPPPVTTPVTTEDPAKAVADAVEAWRDAWSRRDVDRYLEAYTPDFAPAAGIDHAAWAAQRQARLRAARTIRLQLEQLKIDIQGDRATVRFLQHYRAGSVDDQVRKRLLLENGPAGWRIREEVVETPGKS